MTFIDGCRLLISRPSSKPFMPGMVTSVSKSEISAACLAAFSNASPALVALMTGSTSQNHLGDSVAFPL